MPVDNPSVSMSPAALFYVKSEKDTHYGDIRVHGLNVPELTKAVETYGRQAVIDFIEAHLAEIGAAYKTSSGWPFRRSAEAGNACVALVSHLHPDSQPAIERIVAKDEPYVGRLMVGILSLLENPSQHVTSPIVDATRTFLAEADLLNPQLCSPLMPRIELITNADLPLQPELVGLAGRFVDTYHFGDSEREVVGVFVQEEQHGDRMVVVYQGLTASSVAGFESQGLRTADCHEAYHGLFKVLQAIEPDKLSRDDSAALLRSVNSMEQSASLTNRRIIRGSGARTELVPRELLATLAQRLRVNLAEQPKRILTLPPLSDARPNSQRPLRR